MQELNCGSTYIHKYVYHLILQPDVAKIRVQIVYVVMQSSRITTLRYEVKMTGEIYSPFILQRVSKHLLNWRFSEHIELIIKTNLQMWRLFAVKAVE